MIGLEWVEMSPCGFTLVSGVTKLVDMEPVQAGGQTSDGAAEAEIGNGGIFEKFWIKLIQF